MEKIEARKTLYEYLQFKSHNFWTMKTKQKDYFLSPKIMLHVKFQDNEGYVFPLVLD